MTPTYSSRQNGRRFIVAVKSDFYYLNWYRNIFIILLLLISSLSFSQVTVTQTLSTAPWTVPSNVSSVSIELWGGGGGGGYNSNNRKPAGGGGGGGYLKKINVSVTPGSNLSFTTGTGGAGGTSSIAASGGGSTIILGYTANGGNAGNVLNGGTGGTATGGDINSPGANGGTAGNSNDYGGGGGGEAGGPTGAAVGGANSSSSSGGAGGSGGTTGGDGGKGGDNDVSGTAGNVAGGGGGGEGGNGISGGNGAAGQIIVTYTLNCPSSNSISNATAQSICQGVSSTTLNTNVVYNGANGTPTTQYQWYYNSTNSNIVSGATIISGATTASYAPATGASEVGTRYYFCVAYATNNGCGQTNSTQSLASNTAQVTVSATSLGGSISSSQNVCSGSQPVSDLTLTGNIGSTIQWQKSTDNFTTDINNIGSGGTTLTKATIGSLTTTTYIRAVVTNSPCTSAFSNTVILTVVQPPTTSNPGPDQTGSSTCGLTAVTLAGNTPTVGTGAWSIVSGVGGSITTPASPTSTFSGVAGNSYTLRWTISNSPCAPSLNDVLVTFNVPSAGGTVSSSQNVCSGSQPVSDLTLTGNVGSTIQWQKSTDNFTTDINNIGSGGTTLTKATIGSLTTTTYIRAVVTNSPCTSAFSNTVILTVVQPPTTSNPGPDQTGSSTCGLTAVTLAGNTPTVGTGAWSIVSGVGGSITTPASPTSTFSGVAGNSYTLRWTISNSPCAPSLTDVLVTFNVPSAGGTVSSNQNVCIGSQPASNITLASYTGSTIQWQKSTVSDFSAAVSNIGSNSATLTPAEVGSITVNTYIRAMVTNSPCNPAYSTIITLTAVTAPTTATVGGTQNICGALTSANLGGNTPTVGTGAWSQFSGTGTSSYSAINSGSSTATASTYGTKVYAWTISNGGCPPSTAYVTVNFYDNPTTATVGLTQNRCATLTSTSLGGNTPTVGSGQWTQISGPGTSNFSASSSGSSTATASLYGTYIYRWTISNGTCTPSSADITVNYYATPTTATVGSSQNNCGSLTSTSLGGNTPTVGTGTWTQVSGPGITSFSALNSGSSTATASVTGTYIYRWTISNGSCTSSYAEITVAFNPTPDVIITPVNQNACTGSTVNVTFTGNVPSTNFNWTRDNPETFPGSGIAAISGTGSFAGFSGSGSPNGTFSNSTSTPKTITIPVTPTANGCTGSTINATVTVLPVATVNAVGNQTFCHNTSTTAINFSGTGTSYNWTNNNTAIGLGSSGSGNISSFAATNAGVSPISGSISVTPVYTVGTTNCNGTASGFSITINPVPVLTSGLTASVCSGFVFNYSPASSASAVSLTYNWSRAVAPNISNAAASGSGSPAETLVNTSTAAQNVTYVYSISGTNNGVTCTNPSNYNLITTVNPTPTIAANPSTAQVICTAGSSNAITLTNPNGIPGASFAWTRSNTTNISGTTSGTGSSISAIVFTNNTTSVQTTVLTATASAGSCSTSTTISVQVNPPISSNLIASSTAVETLICSIAKQVTFTSPPATGGDGTYTYQWQVNYTGQSANWEDIPGATGQSMIYVYPIQNAFFRRIAYSGGCSGVISDEFHVNQVANGFTQTVTNSGAYCSGTSGVDATLSGSLAGATYTLQYEQSNNNWVNAPGFSPITGTGTSIVFPNITTTGKYRIQGVVSGAGGCTTSFNEFTVSINSLPALPSASNPGTICNGGNVNISATLSPASLNYNWFANPTGGSPINGTELSSGSTLNVSPTTTTTYYAETVNSATGCVSGTRTAVIVTVRQLPVMTSAATAAICSGGTFSIPLTASNTPSSFSWQGIANASVTGTVIALQNPNATLNNNGNALTLNAGVTSTQTVSFTVIPYTSSPTCAGPSQTVVVSIDPKPVVTNQTTTVCSGIGFTITPANGGGNTIPTTPATQYTWSSPPSGTGFGGGVIGTNASNISGTLTNTGNTLATAVYNVVPTAGACTGNPFTVSVNLNPRPSILNQTLAVCSGNSFTITPTHGSGNIVPANTMYSWPAPSGSNISGIASGTNLSSISGTITNTNLSAPQTATYTVTPTGPAGLGSCVGSSFQAVVTINPIPDAAIAGTTAVCQGGASPNIVLTGSNGTQPYTFTYATTVNGVTGADQTVTTSVGSSLNLPVSTATAGTIIYTIKSVKDGTSTACQRSLSSTATITINPTPTLSSISTTAVCSGSNAVITMNGMLASIPSTVTYQLNAVTQPTISVTPNGAGVGSFSIPVTAANNGQTVTITAIQNNSSGCSGNFSQSTSLSVTPTTNATLSGSVTICASANAALTIAIPSGSGTYSGTLSDGTTFSGTAPSFSVIVSPASTNTYTIASISGTCMSTSGTATVSIPSGSIGEWKCTVSSDWFDCRNWAGGVVPTNSTDVVINVPTLAGCNPIIDPSSPFAISDPIARARNVSILNSSNLSIANSGNFYVAGNWTNNVGTAGFTAGNSTVTFMGGSGSGCTQTINTTGASETFNNLVINNSCSTASGDNITLNKPVNVGGMLMLTAGVVKTSTSNILTVTNPAVAAILGGSAASYINGPLTRYTNNTGTYIYPVGAPSGLYGVYRPATVIPGSSSSNSYTGQYFAGAAPEIGNMQLGTTGIINTEYWDIKPANTCSGTAVIGLPYVNPGTASHWTAGVAPCSTCNVAIAKPAQPSNTWYFTDFPNYVGTGFNGSTPEDRFYANSGIIYTKPIDCTGFLSPHFTFGFNYSAILPVGLLRFEGKTNNDDAKLEWEVTDASDLKSFVLEGSKDGNKFNIVSTIPAGNTNVYGFTDKALSSGLHYYRLQVISKSGEKIYSRTIMLVTGKQLTIIRGISPNPVSQVGNINIWSGSRQGARVILYDMTGRLISETRFSLVKGDNQLPMQTGNLGQGVYNLMVIAEDGVQRNLRLMKD